MDDKQRLERLEEVLAQMLRPVKGIPFSVIVKSISGHSILKIDLNDPIDAELIEDLKQTAVICGGLVANSPIRRPRPNEVGNDIEPFVMQAAQQVGLQTSRPVTAKGAGKSTGYPDILIRDRHQRCCYIECKIYSADTANTSMRSFYVSPSESFKVAQDARHLLLAFEMNKTPVPGTALADYVPVAYKLVDLHDLECDVKYEFNSDNRRLYSTGSILAQGRL